MVAKAAQTALTFTLDRWRRALRRTRSPGGDTSTPITNLQHVVSRNTPPLDSVVISVTRISAGTTNNIIPEAVELGGTVRTHREDLREHTRAAIERILGGVTAAHAARYELDYTLGYDRVVNDPNVAALVREAAADDRVVELDPLMAGDDLSAYLRAAPGCFFFVGAGGDGSFPHHHPRFTIDEAALPVLIETMTRAALSFLGAGRRN